MRRDAPPPGRFDDRERFDQRGPPRGYSGGWDDGGWDRPYDDRRAPPPRNGEYGYDGYGRGPGPMMGGDGYGRGVRASVSPHPPLPPHWEDGRGKRPRSRSPPRHDFDRRGPPNNGYDQRGYNDDYRRPGPPGPLGPYPPGPPPPPPRSFNGPEPPDSLPFLVSPAHFADWLRQSQPHQATSPEAIDAAFAQYKKRFTTKTTAAFFDEMKSKPWFRERYSPEKEMVQLRERLRDKNGAHKVDAFLEELQSGRLDDLTFDFDLPPPRATPLPEPTPVAAEVNGDEGEGENSRREEERSSAAQSPAIAIASTFARTQSEYVELPQNGAQLFIKTVTPGLPFEMLEQHCAKVPGFTRLILSDPNPARKLHRFGWIEFENTDFVPEAQALLGESSVDNFTLHLQPNTNLTKLKAVIAPAEYNTPARIALDLNEIKKVATGFEKDNKIDARGSELINLLQTTRLEKTEADKAELGEVKYEQAKAEVAKHTLDLYLHYLRSVFSSCYYCLARYDHQEQLHRRCPAHYRGSADSRSKQTPGQASVREFDEKAVLWTGGPDAVSAATFGGLDAEEEISQICKDSFKQEEAGKFRCTECNKLFGARKFIGKHVVSRHPDKIDLAQVDKLTYLNNYALDPNKVTFAAPDAGPGAIVSRMTLAGPPMTFALNNAGSRSGTPSGGASPMLLGPPMKIEHAMQSLGQPDRGNKRIRRVGPFEEREERKGPPPPPPVGARLDPRARRAVTGYDDLDGAPGGDADEVELKY